MRKRIAVLAAAKAMVQAALPAADIRGMDNDEAKPTRVGAQGMGIVRSGDPGTPDIDLSPPTWWWEHRIPVELAGYQVAGKTSQQVLDEMIAAIDARRRADPTLGGLCIYLDAEPPTDGETETVGTMVLGWADFALVASYSTDSPLG